MITTSQVVYPILIAGKHGKFGFRKSPCELVERADSLRRLNTVNWLRVIDGDFNFYKMERLRPIAGAGRWWGFFFEGPFLSRRVVYEADLSFMKRATPDEVMDLLLGFMKSSQSFKKKDELAFQQMRIAIDSSGRITMSNIMHSYENLNWGDQS